MDVLLRVQVFFCGVAVDSLVHDRSARVIELHPVFPQVQSQVLYMELDPVC